ncbi:MAG: DUF1499 domain-containing protein [Methylobacterium mesophilicum]|nr:DUF1499 domain-containing protein [Methylobacterium mesophilicum]
MTTRSAIARDRNLPRPVKRSATAGLARRMAWFAGLLFVVSGAAHRFGLLTTEAFATVLAVVAGVAGAALLLALFAWRRVWVKGFRGAGDVAHALIVSLLVLLPFGWAGAEAMTHPMLSDIATDLDDPPALASREPLPEAAKTEQAQAYPEVVGHRYPLPVERLSELVRTMMEERGWVPVEQADATDGITLRAPARTLVLGFTSDVVIRITDEGETSYVDMRSRSRFGRTDLGDNAARIAGFLADLDTRAASVTAVPTVED